MARSKNESPAKWPDEAMSLQEFRALVGRMGAENERVLPWRYIDDPYAVLVSEVMLQQTQVTRVLNYWPRFLEKFPTLEALSAAETAEVLAMWQGLGYNRRALALKAAAEQCANVAQPGTSATLPRTVDELVALPGVGPATAAGIVAFAYGEPAMYLETNVRAVFLHCLFPNREKVADRELEPLVRMACPSENARHWYYDLLDFGAHLKATGNNAARRSAHHTRQSTFEGSRRQKRAELVRMVLAAPAEGITFAEAVWGINAFEAEHGRGEVDPELVRSIADDLVSEGFFKEDAGRFRS